MQRRFDEKQHLHIHTSPLASTFLTVVSARIGCSLQHDAEVACKSWPYVLDDLKVLPMMIDLDLNYPGTDRTNPQSAPLNPGLSFCSAVF